MSVVIDDFHIERIAFLPLEANAPLIVHAYAVAAFTTPKASSRFAGVTWWITVNQAVAPPGEWFETADSKCVWARPWSDQFFL
jgi:hypothetical protein